MIATKSGRIVIHDNPQIPIEMVYEIIDGQPIHYKGYQEVLAGEKDFSEIRYSSGLRSFLLAYCLTQLMKNLDEDEYLVLSSGLGLHLDDKNNLIDDICVFQREVLPIENIDENYADVPPKMIVEVDIMAAPSDIDPTAYLFKKTQKLLDFGVEKVNWVTTDAKKVTVATPGTNWQVMDWDNGVEIVGGITCNVGKYLADKGFPFA